MDVGMMDVAFSHALAACFGGLCETNLNCPANSLYKKGTAGWL